jgi:hypothetical protein
VRDVRRVLGLAGPFGRGGKLRRERFGIERRELGHDQRELGDQQRERVD